MNISLVSYELPPLGGGEGTYTYNLARGLVGLGHNVTVMVPSEVAKQSSQRLNLDAIKLRPIQGASKPLVRVSSFLSNAIKFLASNKTDSRNDLVHFTFDYPPFPVSLKGINCPVFCTLHHLHKAEALKMLHHERNSIALVPNVVRQFLLSSSEGTLLRQSRAIIAVSKFTYDSAVELAGVEPSKLRVVPNGIDISSHSTPRSHNAIREKYGLHSEKIILFVGRIEKSKGIEFLIRGFAKVCENRSDARLLIVGAGDSEYIGRLRREASKARVSDKVFFTGRVEQDLLLDGYDASEVFVLPSMMEGFGLTLLEAMMRGKPVIATNVGAIPEIVKNGVTGLLVEPGNPTELGFAISKILSDHSLAMSLGKFGRELVVNNYTIERMARLTEKMYKEFL